MTFLTGSVPTVKWIRRLFHDFNSPAGPSGYHHVTLDPTFEAPKPGDEVIIGDSEVQRRGRVRCLIAVVEPIGEFEDI